MTGGDIYINNSSPISSHDKTLFRLAAYIENVRRLELENGRLEQQVSSIEETNTREVTSVRNMYDKELSQVEHYHVMCWQLN